MAKSGHTVNRLHILHLSRVSGWDESFDGFVYECAKYFASVYLIVFCFSKSSIYRLCSKMFLKDRLRSATAKLRRDEGSNVHCALSIFVNTIAYRLGRYEPSSPYTKELRKNSMSKDYYSKDVNHCNLTFTFEFKRWMWRNLIRSCQKDDNVFPPLGHKEVFLAKSFVYLLYLTVSWVRCHTCPCVVHAVWPDLAKFHQFNKNLEIFSNIWNVYLIFGKVANTLWDFLYAFGQNFIVVNGQILKRQSGHLVTWRRNI